ncbi:MAG: hypothetical protein IKL04_02155 [Lachnospiraceae bacterium]|nr:hypothetical protein [Lachnospiraceae bacterium]
MKFPILASLFVFILIIGHNVRKQRNSNVSAENNFWQEETRANSVRRVSLDDLNYITIPSDTLPVHLLQEDPAVAECVEFLGSLSGQRIVNLTGYSNTELKLKYGTANITLLSEYDQNYTLLVTTLQKWADLLYNAGYVEETLQILEFALSTGTDISKTYYMLADIYRSKGQQARIQELIEAAENLRSINRSVIVRTLAKSYQ